MQAPGRGVELQSFPAAGLGLEVTGGAISKPVAQRDRDLVQQGRLVERQPAAALMSSPTPTVISISRTRVTATAALSLSIHLMGGCPSRGTSLKKASPQVTRQTTPAITNAMFCMRFPPERMLQAKRVTVPYASTASGINVS
jgi:hypothetical protein